ncbi:MAG: DMT family transporter [Deltaproteobacteria bacterium]|nr:DMT family transporter [Deltaproteobacteria bacterium]MBW2137413.1 DMT family transporter [Deltaproteobacteria bacterium]
MELRTLKGDGLCLVTACIWGFAFVAQRVGMEYVGPFTFTGVRFALGSMSLVPLILLRGRERQPGANPLSYGSLGWLVKGGGLAGVALFFGVSFQQVGLVYTTAGKAGFITGLYVVIVPVLGVFFHQKTRRGTWLGAVLAAAGLYLLSVTGKFSISRGDFLELIGAFFWAGHVLIIGWLSPRMDPLKLASFQFGICSLISLVTAIFFESVTWSGIMDAGIPILYGGLCSVGVAYTLQVVAQRHAKPAHAAILLSLEAVFAALGGWVVLGEILSPRGITGCALMLSGMLLSQVSTHLPGEIVSKAPPS